MPEIVDANTEVVKGAVNSGDFNKNADDFLDSLEQSSGSKDAMGNPVEPKETTGDDQSKKSSLETEVAKVSSEEEKLSKIAEILGDDEKAIEAYIKKMGYHKDPAWQKLLAKSRTPAIDEETQKSLETFKQVTSSPEYIRTMMKNQGYTEDAIDKELASKGFQTAPKVNDDIQLIAQSLGIKSEDLDPNTRAIVGDVAKIADIIFKNRMDKVLPQTMKPIEDTVQSINQANTASRLVKTMEETVKGEGVLEFDKDIKPVLEKFMDEFPDSTQEDVFSHFKEINARLTIDRLKSGKKTVERTEKKEANRPLGNHPTEGMKVPSKTGDFNKDADALFDALGVR